MAYSEDHIALAAEYALGTLDAEERSQVEVIMAVDKDYAAMVRSWEIRLGVLNQMVGPVEPRPELWERVRSAVAAVEEQARKEAEARAQAVAQAMAQAEAQAAPQPAPAPAATEQPANDLFKQFESFVVTPPAATPSAAAPSMAPPSVAPPVAAPEPVAPAVDTGAVIRLTARASRWRNIAAGMTAVAAVLVGLIAAQVYQPDLLPPGMRPKPKIQTVEVKIPPPPLAAQYVALLQRDGSSPAFILTVDASTKNFTVRRVGAAPESGKSYELWIVSDKLQRPRSLGVIGGNDFTVRPLLSSYDTDTVNRATYAVTLEPEGGSPTGVATGPVVFSGKLIETVPPQPPASQPRR